MLIRDWLENVKCTKRSTAGYHASMLELSLFSTASLSPSLFAYYSILLLPSSIFRFFLHLYPKLRPSSSSSSSCSTSSSPSSFCFPSSSVLLSLPITILHPSSSLLSSPLPSSPITLVLCPSYTPLESSRYLWNLLDRASAAFLVARSKTSLEEEPPRVSVPVDPGDRGNVSIFITADASARRTPCQIAARFCRGFSRPAPPISRTPISVK